MPNHVSASMREDTPHETETTDFEEDVSDREKIEALADIICGAGDKAAGALFVLMGTLQNSTEPGALSNANATCHEVIVPRELRPLAMRGLEGWNPDIARTIYGYDAAVIWKRARASSSTG